jgi:hypothetical protein
VTRAIGARHWLIACDDGEWREMMRDPDAARLKPVTDALLTMVKLDIAALEQAYRS